MKPWKEFFSNLFSTWEKCVSLNCGNFCRTTHLQLLRFEKFSLKSNFRHCFFDLEKFLPFQVFDTIFSNNKLFFGKTFFVLGIFPTWKIFFNTRFLIQFFFQFGKFNLKPNFRYYFSNMKNCSKHLIFYSLLITFLTWKTFSDTKFVILFSRIGKWLPTHVILEKSSNSILHNRRTKHFPLCKPIYFSMIWPQSALFQSSYPFLKQETDNKKNIWKMSKLV